MSFDHSSTIEADQRDLTPSAASHVERRVENATNRTTSFIESSRIWDWEGNATAREGKATGNHDTAGLSSNKLLFKGDLSKVIQYSLAQTPRERPDVAIVAVQEWEGRVDATEADHFRATLIDVSADAHRPTDTVAIPFAALDEEDRHLIAPGVIFRLVVGRERRGGSVKNTTLIYVRRRKYRPQPTSSGSPSFHELFSDWK